MASVTAQPPKVDLPNTRPFEFVPYGKEWPEGRGRAFTCDGLVKGGGTGDHVMQLSHWNGNTTAARFYADTSTEIALNFVEAVRDGKDLEAVEWGARESWVLPTDVDTRSLIGALAHTPAEVATVLNNHYDTDGLLSVWALLQPEAALQYRQLLVEASEAGDFDEWPASDEGLKLQFAIEARTEQLLAERDDDDDGEPEGAWLYRHMLPLVGDIVREVAAGGGEALWGPSYDGCRKYYAALKSGAVTAALLEPGQDGQLLEVVDVAKPGSGSRVGMVVHPLDFDGILYPHALHRYFFGQGNSNGTVVDRYLLVVTEQPEEDDTPLYTYYYTRPMYAWAPTTKRIRIAVPDNINKIPAVLTEETGGRWEKDDDSLAGLVKTRDPVALEPEEIVMKLLDLDNGMPFTFEEP